jgi:hypothetical protein
MGSLMTSRRGPATGIWSLQKLTRPISTRTDFAAVKNRRAHQAARGLDGKFLVADELSGVPQNSAKKCAGRCRFFPPRCRRDCKSSARISRFWPAAGRAGIPSEPTPKLRWQIRADLRGVSGDGKFSGSMTM